MRRNRFCYSSYAVLAASVLLSAPSAAAAQPADGGEQATSEPVSDGEILVTARRRLESLQEVPVSIGVLGEDAIEASGIASVSQVAQLTPGLQFDVGSSPADIRPSLRGVSLIEGRSNVAIVVDGIDATGVSLNTLLGGGGAQTATALMDLERIEVVKGPQTVYFGRSAFAGAIQFISRDPEFDFGGTVNAAVGGHGQREITGHVTGPLVADTVAFKLSATYNKFGGFYENPGDGVGLDALETYGVGGTLLVDSGPLKAKFRATYINQDAGPGAGFITPRADISLFGVNRIGESVVRQNLDQIAISSDHHYAGNDSDTYRAVLDLELDLGGGFTLSSLSGYSVVDSHLEFDFDKKPANTPIGIPLGGDMELCLPIVCVGIYDFDTSLKQLSTELRLAYEGDGYRAMVGGYFFDESYEELDYTRFVGARPFITSTRANIPVRPSLLDTKTYSAFGSLELDVTDQLTVTGELRFNHEVIEAAAATSVNILFLDGSNAIDFRAKKSFDSWLPRLSIGYEVNSDLNFYASVAKGSKPGGFNTGQILDELRPFGQETIWTYEIGAKGRVFDILTFEASAYYSNWRNIQVINTCYGSSSPFGPEAACPASAAINISYLINADKATVKGLELSATLEPTEWLDLSLAYAYTDSKFKDFATRDIYPAPADDTTRQFAGNRVPLIPRHSLTSTMRVDVPVSATLDGFASLTGIYRSSRFANFDNRVLLDSKFVANAQLGISNDMFTALLFVNNIFNDLTPDYSRYYPNFNPSDPNGEYITAPAKRTAGVRVIFDF